MKILLIQTAFIGDVILATPIVEKIRQHDPDAQIDFLLRKGNESLLAYHPHIRNVWVWDKINNKYSNFINITRSVRAEAYDKIINLHRFASSGLITSLSGAKEKIGFDKNPFSFAFSSKFSHHITEDTHEVERNLSLISSFTDSDIVSPKLYPSEADFQKVQHEGEYICIAPASIWFTKQLPAEKWIEFIRELDQKFMLFLLGGKADAELCEHIRDRSGSDRIQILAGKLSFLESAALMKNAHMNFVNDSAPMHLASAMNAPVAAVFCSTVPGFGFGPLSDVSHVLETELKLDCRPCGLHGKKSCPLGHFNCADIDVGRMLVLVNNP